MEDLWKDITLSTLTSSSSSPLHNDPSSSPTTIFQNFLTLARPFSSSISKNNILQSVASSTSNSPQTTLTLNNPHDIHPPVYTPFNNSTCSSSGIKHSNDRRHKRMIKNRESAARSRARKQAYTIELELEVAQLKQENARLRMEQEMQNQGALNHHSPKQHKLHRTLTAPF